VSVYKRISMDKALYLVSGGIDSPVASYLGIRRGWRPVFLYFDNAPFTGADTKERALKTIKRVREITGVKGETIIVPHGKDLEVIVGRCQRNLSCLLCKRMMYRKAERIAHQYGCGAIVTGEILGEQASQTLRNLILDSAIIDSPILRPLLGMNKLEVEEIAKEIGTFEISTLKVQPCSAAAVKARTRAKPEELEREEEKIPIEELVKEGVRSAVRVGSP
jgi:thiamine biosynthesis protein ThiI